MKKALADALDERGYTKLTPVQEAVTKKELGAADLLVSAQTGSGKTLGFGLAIAPQLLGDEDSFPKAAEPLALVVAPTRELAMQVKRELAWLYAKAGAVVASCVGGMDMRDERRSLGRGAHVVVATPGRLRDHIMRKSIDLSCLKAVVLDEADEMLDLGFREDLEFILGKAPEERQTLLFSATVPQAIASLAKNYQKEAVRITVKSEHTQHADIEYRAMNVVQRDSDNAIINTLRYYEAPNALVFCNTRAMVNRLTTRLSNRGFSVVALSGELSQTERTHALQAMRDGRARICVATDVAARGIDLPTLDLVVHADLPSNHETLLHRSGRTGRAGRKGVSVLIVPAKSRKLAQRLLSWGKLKAEWSSAPSADAVKARDEERMLADPAWQDEVTEAERGAVENLVERFTPSQIAAAYLRLYHSRHSAPEELSNVEEKQKQEPRESFGPSVWFSIAGGHDQNAEPRRLLPMICKAGGITNRDIGAIRIQQDLSYIEIREASVASFLATVGPDMKVEGGAALIQLDAPPAAARGPRSAPPPKQRDNKPGFKKSKRPKTGKSAPGYEELSHREKKPRTQWDPAKSEAAHAQEPARADASGEPAVSTQKPEGRKAKWTDKSRNFGKGPQPPKGKPNSKKNKARAKAAAAKAGGKADRKGGGGQRRPKR